jgi:putative acetyltransferase
MNINLRPEQPDDYEGITRVNDISFQRKAEGKLVEELRKLKGFDPRLSIIAESKGEIVGHILFTPVDIENNGQKYRSLTLAPMSVLPEYQKKSIGKLLIIFGLQMAKDAGYQSVVVLGHPSYYPKLGFVKASNWNIKSPFPAPDDAFMVKELSPGALDGIEGKVIFPDAFDDV